MFQIFGDLDLSIFMARQWSDLGTVKLFHHPEYFRMVQFFLMYPHYPTQNCRRNTDLWRCTSTAGCNHWMLQKVFVRSVISGMPIHFWLWLFQVFVHQKMRVGKIRESLLTKVLPCCSPHQHSADERFKCVWSQIQKWELNWRVSKRQATTAIRVMDCSH